MLGDAPIMQYAGSNVNLTINTEFLNLMIMESGEVCDVYFCVACEAYSGT